MGGIFLLRRVQRRSPVRLPKGSSSVRIRLCPHSPPAGSLVVQEESVWVITEESVRLIERFPDHPVKDRRHRWLACRDEVVELAAGAGDSVSGEALCIVNTEVNSSNFIVVTACATASLVMQSHPIWCRLWAKWNKTSGPVGKKLGPLCVSRNTEQGAPEIRVRGSISTMFLEEFI